MRLFEILRSVCVLLGLLIVLHLAGTAQVNTANITGTVLDPTGAAIPDATLTLKSTATGTERTATSNGDGGYNFQFIPIGEYTLQVAHTGFQVQKQSMTLRAADQLRLDFNLPVAQDTTVVQVSADSVALDTVTPQQNVSLSEQSLNQLPVSHQDWTSILQLGAGLSTEGGGPSPAGTSLTINGLPPAGFNLTVDGTNATSDPEAPAFGFYQAPNIINTINNDAIAEVSVVKGIAGATIGGTLSGNVNIITKSGTNSFHGSLYEINDVSAYDARNQFVTKKPRSTFNEYGGSIGGKIIPNRLFFFGSYEGARVSAFQAISGTVPTPYFRSEVPSIYDPVLNNYPGVAQPASNPTALTATYFGTGSLRQNDGNGTARLDYNPNDSNLIYVRYIRSRPYKLTPNVIAINARSTTGHTDAFNAGYTHVGRGWTALTRYGYNRIRLQRLDQGFATDLEELIVAGIDSEGAEQFRIAGQFNTFEQQYARTIGNHALTAGFILQRQDTGRTDYNTALLGYGSLGDFINNSPNRVQITFDLNTFNLYDYQYGGFLQDDWKATPNLTVNLGVRYDYFTVPKEDSGRIFNRGVDPANPALGPGYGDYRPADSMYNGDFNNIQPRVGFAWSVGKNQNTVIRGGSGIFVSPHPIFGGPIDLVQNSASQPFRINLTGQQAATSGLAYPLQRTDYDQALANLQSSGVISTKVVNTSINSNFPDPYSVQWMFGIEQNLPFSQRIEIDYLGNRALKLNMTEQKNLPDRITGILPQSNYPQFRYYYAGDASSYHGLQLQLIKAPWHGLSYGASYAWSKVLSFADANLLLQTAPQDNDKIKADYGPPSFDVRHRFTSNFLWSPPIERWAHWNTRTGNLVLGGWQVSGIVKGETGLPYNIVNSGSSYPSDRPDAVAGVSQYLAVLPTSHQYLNPAAFAAVAISPLSKAQVRGGTLGRDAIRAPGSIVFDAEAVKSFKITETMNFQIKADAFNSLNHTNYSGLVTNIASGTFGQLTSATARTMQLTGRFTF